MASRAALLTRKMAAVSGSKRVGDQVGRHLRMMGAIHVGPFLRRRVSVQRFGCVLVVFAIFVALLCAAT